jgi:hypothetical protein
MGPLDLDGSISLCITASFLAKMCVCDIIHVFVIFSVVSCISLILLCSTLAHFQLMCITMHGSEGVHVHVCLYKCFVSN